MGDFYHEGFGAGLVSCDWLEVVAGRFLREWERKELASGWRAGLAELDEYEREVARHNEFEASVELERAGVAGDDEIPF